MAAQVRCIDGISVEAANGRVRLGERASDLVALVVATGPRGVTVDEALDALYGGDVSKRNALQKMVSRINRDTGGTINLDSGRYRFTNEVSVDLWTLDSAVKARDVRQIVNVLEPDDGFDPFGGRVDIARVLAAGEEARVNRSVGWELVALATDHQHFSHLERQIVSAAVDDLTNERLVTAVAGALYRLGRQDAALDTLARCRDALRENLGIEPGTEFDRIELAILRQDDDSLAVHDVDNSGESSDALIHAMSSPLLPPSKAFVGRSRELHALDQALIDLGSSRRGNVVVVEAVAGMGKSELVKAFAHGLADSDCVVRSGAGLTRDSLSYEPFIDAIPELEPHIVSLADSSDPGVARLMFWHEVSRTLAELARHTPVAVVLEDLHDADSQSAMLLRFLASGLPPGVLLVATTRPPVRGTTWAEVMPSLLQSGAAIHVALEPFDEMTTAQLVRRRFPSASRIHSRNFARQLVVASGGIPLVADSVCRSLEAPADLLTSTNSTEETFARSLRDRIDEDLFEPLGVAGLVGLEFDSIRLANLMGIDEMRILVQLERAMRRGVIIELPDGRFRFDHVLTRDAFVSALSSRRRTLLAKTLAESDGASPTSRVRWLHHAGVAVDTDRAYALLIEDAEALTRALAFAEAHGAFSLAVELLEAAGRDVPIDVLIALSTTAAQMGDLEMSAAHRKAAFGRAQHEDDVDRMAAAAAAGLPEAEEVAGDVVRLQMLSEIDITRLSTFSKSWFARCLFRAARTADDHATCVSLTEATPDFGDDRVGALMFGLEVDMYLDQIGAKRLTYDDFEVVARRIDSPEERADVRFRSLLQAIIDRAPRATTDTFDSVRREVVVNGSVRTQWTLQLLWAALRITGGRDDGPTPEVVYDFGLRHGITDAFQGYGVQRFLQHWMNGTLDVAHEELQLFSSDLPTNPPWRAARCLAATAAGDMTLAEIERDAVLVDIRTGVAEVHRRTTAMVLAAAAHLASWTDAANELAPVLEPRRGSVEILGLGSGIVGSVDAALDAMTSLASHGAVPDEDRGRWPAHAFVSTKGAASDAQES